MRLVIVDFSIVCADIDIRAVAFHFLPYLKYEQIKIQYYRDAVNHYLEAIRYSEMVKPITPDYEPTKEEIEARETNDDPVYTPEELDEFRSVLYSNVAMAHMQLKNWGHTRDNSERVRAKHSI